MREKGRDIVEVVEQWMEEDGRNMKCSLDLYSVATFETRAWQVSWVPFRHQMQGHLPKWDLKEPR